MSRLPIDHKERQAAINPVESIILQAPAGSGKTEVLIQRYLNLLAKVTNPEEVVALTFTNKAANEMRQRVINELNQAKVQADLEALSLHKQNTLKLATAVLNRDKSLGWNLLQSPGRLQIKTFDSLYLSLVRRAPLLSKNHGIDNPTDDAEKIYEAAAIATLAMLDDADFGPDIKVILQHLANDIMSFKDLLKTMLLRRDQWLRIGLLAKTDNIIYALEQSWDQLREVKVSKLQACFNSDEVEQFKFFEKYANSNLKQEKKREHAKYGENITQTLKCIKNWYQLSFTTKGTIRLLVDVRSGFPSKSDEQKQIKRNFLGFISGFKIKDELIDLWTEVARLPLINFAKGKSALVKSMIKVLKLALANLKLEFNLTKEVDYIEIAEAASYSLGELENPSQLGLYLDAKISHILIDEFQDTSHSQFEFLQKLTSGWTKDEGQTLFVVGDPMQSIYGFRQADVGLFLKVRQNGINDISLKPLRLKVNFRSGAQIVNWVNQNFNTIFPASNDYLSGAVSYARSTAFAKDISARVSLKGFIAPDTDKENLELVKVVKKILADYQGQPDKKIAILVRSRRNLDYILHLLNLENINYRAVEMAKLDQSQTIEDLRSLTRALLHLGDRAAWLSVLRAPWCGLKLKEIQQIVDFDQGAQIWDLLNNEKVQARLNPDARLRLSKLHGVFSLAFDLSSSIETEQLIKVLWHELGADKYSKDYEFDLVDKFIDCVSRARINTGIALDKLDYELSRFYLSPDNDAECQLECMTIHKAKGLEFDTVILPMLGKAGRANSQDLFRFAERIIAPGMSPGLLLAPIKAKGQNSDEAYDYIGRINKLKNHYEEMRVLYVAATRAKQHLVLFASKKDADAKPQAGSHLALLAKAFTDNFVIEQNQEIVSEPDSYPKLRRRKTENINLIEYKSVPDVAGEFIFKLSSRQQIAAGIAYHAACEHLAQKGIDKVESEVLASFVYAKLKLNVQSHQNLDKEHELVMQALANTLTDETGRWILKSRAKAHNEWRISRIKAAKVQEVVIDRAFVTDGTWWIIDYKLTAPKPGETEDDFDKRMYKKYRAQLDLYKSAVEQITNLPVTTMLYFPLLPKKLDMVN